MSEFSQEHLEVIRNIRDELERNYNFRHDYFTSKMLHSCVEWFCNDPELPDDPKTVWKAAINYVDKHMDDKDGKKNWEFSDWRKLMGTMFRETYTGYEMYQPQVKANAASNNWVCTVVKSTTEGYYKPAFTENHREVIALIQDALKHNDGFRAIYDDKIDFHDRVDRYCRTPMEDGGTFKDPELKEFVVDLLTEIMLWRDPIKEFKALLKAIDIDDNRRFEEDDWSGAKLPASIRSDDGWS